MKSLDKNTFICMVLFVLMVFCIGTVSAEDITHDTNLTSDYSGEVVSASGDTIYVDSSSTSNDEQGTEDNPYKTISAAVNSDKVTGGETIFIKNGLYSENVVVSPKKSMSFVGESQEGVIITSNSSNAGIFKISENGIALSFKNLTFKDVNAGKFNLPMRIGGNQDLYMGDCSFIDCSSKFGAFQIYTSAAATIENIKILNFKSSATAGTGGIYLTGNGVYNLKNILIDNSTYSGSSGQMQGIVYLYGSGSSIPTAYFSNLTISNCNVISNSIIRSSGNLNIKNSRIVNNSVLKNSNGAAGDGIFYDTHSINITTSVIANNSCPKIALYKTPDKEFTMNYCNIRGNTYGTGFADGGDYDVNYNYWGSNSLPDGVVADVWVIDNDGTYQLSNGEDLTVEIPELYNAPPSVIIHVDAIAGDDTNNGSAAAPVKTIAKAVELAQGEGKSGKIIVNAGTYAVNNIQTTAALYISSNGTVIFDGKGGRALYVKSGNLHISGITFTNCNESNSGSIIRMDTNATLIADNCIFTKNGGETYRQSLIYVDGADLTVTNSVFSDNAAHKTSTSYGSIYVKNQGKLHVDNCNFTDNFLKYGLYISSSNAEVYNSNFFRNKGTSSSGSAGIGIYVSGTSSAYSTGKSGKAIVKNCSFINNTAISGTYYGGKGGAIYVNNNASMDIDGCYFENNVALTGGGPGQGGAIYASAGAISVNNSVFKNNVADNGSEIYLKYHVSNSSNPLSAAGLNKLNITNSIILSDVNGAIYADNKSYVADVNENFWGTNVEPSDKVSDNIDIGNWIALTANINPADAQIGDEVTINAAFSSLVYADGSVVNYNRVLPDGLKVTFTSSSGNLNEEVDVANGEASTTYTIDANDKYITASYKDAVAKIPLGTEFVYVSPDGSDANLGSEAEPVATLAHAIEISSKGKIIVLAGTYKTGNLGYISENLTIIGVGNVIFDGENANRILYFGADAKGFIANVTFANGYVTGESGALIGNAGNLTIENCTFANSTSAKNGGAIYNAGILTIRNSIFENNKAKENGGAIFTQNAGIGVTPELIIEGTVFSNNSAVGTGNFGGGAIFVQQAKNNLLISNSNFTSNHVERSGGGAIEIVNTNKANITSCNFVSNTAKGEDASSNHGGAAISFVGSYEDIKETLTVYNSLFENNSVEGLGGGAIYVRAATANIANSVFINNLDNSNYTIYSRVTSYTTPKVTANDNWWGTNDSPKGFVSDKVTLNRWAILTVSNDTEIVAGENVTITANINSYNNGVAVGELENPICIPRDVTISTSNGDIKGKLESGEFSYVYNVPLTLKYIKVTVDNQSEMIYLISSTINVKLENITVKKGDRPTYVINVTDDGGTIVNQGNIELFINNISFANLTVANGIAKGKFVISLDEGTYDVVAKYRDNGGLFEENFGTGSIKVSGNNNNIYVSNFFDFFDEDGYMYTDIPFNSLTFRDTFNAKDLGINKITFTAPMTFNNYGKLGIFNNITFDVVSQDITLRDLTLILNNGISGSAIYVAGDDVSLNALKINYETVANSEAYGIFANGVDNLTVSGIVIDIVSNSIGSVGYHQYAIKVRDSTNVVVTGGNINANLPACDVDYEESGIDADLVLAIGIQGSENVTIANARINTNVIGAYGSYPTLDSIMAKDVTNLLISKNTIAQTDFITTGAGYSNVVDLYTCNDAQIMGNNILVNSTAGTNGAGTAYPIQLTGPYKGLLVDGNTLTAISRGPRPPSSWRSRS